jgi:hypothetical protein
MIQLKRKAATPAMKPLINVSDNRLADTLAPAFMDFTIPDCCSFSPTEWMRIWYVREWPHALADRQWQRIVNFEGDVRLSLFLDPLAPGAVGGQLEQQATAISAGNVLRAMQRRDPSMAVSKEHADVLKAQWQVQIEQEPFFYLTVAFALYGKSKDDLDYWSVKLEEIFRESGMVVDRAVRQQRIGLIALQPLNTNTLGAHQRHVPLDGLAQFFPFTGQETIRPKGIYYGQSLSNGMTVALDLFELDNPNTVIIGPPGGGKSYWMKDTITQYVVSGARVYVLDIEGEYELLCDDLGGRYVDMGIRSKHKINVLDPDPEDEKPVEDRTGLAGAYQQFKGWLTTAIGRGLEAGDLPALDRAYVETFSRFGITLDDPRTLRKPAPKLEDLYNTLAAMGHTANDPYALRLASELYPMAVGMERGAFNCATDIDIRSNPFVVFGLKNVPDPMKARRIRQIQQFTWNQMLSGSLRRTIEIVDEAWFLLQHPHTANDLAERARRFRKKNGALIVATQYVDDFLKSADAKAVLDIASTHLLFKQKELALPKLAGLFEMTEGEIAAIKHFQAGDYLLRSNTLSLALHKHVPASRHSLYTTKPEEVLAYQQAQQKQAGGGR